MTTLTTTLKKRKLIDLTPDTFVILSTAAAASGKTLKGFIEGILFDYSVSIKSNFPDLTERLCEALKEIKDDMDGVKNLPCARNIRF